MNNDSLVTLKQIAGIAHCGGLAGLTEADAIKAIRLLTLTHWNMQRPIDQAILDTQAAVRASKMAQSR